MKYRTLVRLLFSTLLTLPALSQQTSPNSGAAGKVCCSNCSGSAGRGHHQP